MAFHAQPPMRLFVLGSGSSGNALLIESDGVRVLVDAGLGPRACARRLRGLGQDLFPRGVDALVVTHEHGDHAAHLVPLAKALGCPLWLHEGISAPVARERFPVVAMEADRAVALGPLLVETMSLPHDCPNVAVRVSGPSGTVAYATDLGHVPRGLGAFLGESDVALVESNHCLDRLQEGPYPERLKRRISSELGHLSNDQAGALVAEMGRYGDPLVALCHLSLTNNSPSLALASVRALAPRARLVVLEHGTPETLPVERSPGRRPGQLELGFRT